MTIRAAHVVYEGNPDRCGCDQSRAYENALYDALSYLSYAKRATDYIKPEDYAKAAARVQAVIDEWDSPGCPSDCTGAGHCCK